MIFPEINSVRFGCKNMGFYSLIYYFIFICRYINYCSIISDRKSIQIHFYLLDAFIVLFSFRSFTKTVFGQCALKPLSPFRDDCFHFITEEKLCVGVSITLW